MEERKPETLRCAVYVRKSNEKGLELAYNSLHAQFDAASAFIRSHESLGWVQMEKVYEDGGYTGGNMNRPALQQLFADIRAGLVDVVVAYRYDRLTRSFMDFARILELFEHYNVAFVSVSEPIDTSSPMGKFLPGILILIAQVERENDSRRIQDKINASRRKGLWTGGITPVGYKRVDRRLVPDEVYAPVVKAIFERYKELGSPKSVARELNLAQRLRPNGKKWTTDHIATIVRNPVYAGIIVISQTGEMCKAVHEPLITVEEFRKIRAVQKLHTRREGKKATHCVPLRGKVYCGVCGKLMTPMFTCRKHDVTTRYAYFKCMRGQELAEDNCPIKTVPERMLNSVVATELAAFMARDRFLNLIANGDRKRMRLLKMAFEDPERFGDVIVLTELQRFCELLLDKVIVREDGIVIYLRNVEGVIDECFKERVVFCKMQIKNNRLYVTKRRKDKDTVSFPQPPALVKMIAKGRKWVELLASGTYGSADELAKKLNVGQNVVRDTMRLAFLSPEIVEALVRGKAPFARSYILAHESWSLMWEDQLKAAKMIGPVPTKVEAIINKIKGSGENTPKPEEETIDVEVS